jgi:hypothetical protein
MSTKEEHKLPQEPTPLTKTVGPGNTTMSPAYNNVQNGVPPVQYAPPTPTTFTPAAPPALAGHPTMMQAGVQMPMNPIPNQANFSMPAPAQPVAAVPTGYGNAPVQASYPISQPAPMAPPMMAQPQQQFQAMQPGMMPAPAGAPSQSQPLMAQPMAAPMSNQAMPNVMPPSSPLPGQAPLMATPPMAPAPQTYTPAPQTYSPPAPQTYTPSVPAGASYSDQRLGHANQPSPGAPTIIYGNAPAAAPTANVAAGGSLRPPGQDPNLGGNFNTDLAIPAIPAPVMPMSAPTTNFVPSAGR